MDRRDRLIREREHDPYKVRLKLRDPSQCPECKALFRNGRWQWGLTPADAQSVLCPACRRVRDDCPAGVLTLVGKFHLEHRTEVLGLLRHVEEREAKNHSLKRIMGIAEGGEEMEVRTTDSGLARNLGVALHRAYDGALDYQYPDEGALLRVRWER